MRQPVYRACQAVLRGYAYLLPWRRPALIQGEDCLPQLPAQIGSAGVDSVLIVTDPTLLQMGLPDGLYEKLREASIAFSVYGKTVSNPTIDTVEEALLAYHAGRHNGIVALGGGSVIDCAKAVGARVAQPNRSVAELRGVMRANRRIPPLFAVPTTGGSGSEATVGAVVTDPRTHEKYALMGMTLIPHTAVLDPLLTRSLPPDLTAATGMDALCHAVEAYLGLSNTRESRACAKSAVRLIFRSLYAAYADGTNMRARADMQRAAYYAGLAATRAYLGNVHAVAHTLGGFYGVPHGLANAVLLPVLLRLYGKAAHRRLAELADAAGLGEGTAAQKAERFIAEVEALNARMGIPERLGGIREQDIPVMAGRAYREANPFYPVPVMLSREEFRGVYARIRQ